jgi:hypothetical protein
MKKNVLPKQVIHILVFGFLLALILFLMNGPPTSRDEIRRVVIDESDIAQLRAAWIRQWNREPTMQELQGLLRQFIREEVLYREAKIRGFDKDDIIVRRAMMRKMEFIGESQVENQQPTDEEIQAYYTLRQEKYRIPATISFVQIYYNRDQRGDRCEEDALQALDQIRQQIPKFNELSSFGDRFMLPAQYNDQTGQQVRSQFGEEFAQKVFSFEKNKWGGPIESGYGLHLVFVYEKTEAVTPGFMEVKAQVLKDMESDAKKAAKELFYTEILRNYQVVFRGQTLDSFGESAAQ